MKLNGKTIDVKQGTTIFNLLESLKLSDDKVVVEVNYEIVSPEQFPNRTLNNADKVEVVSFVGGG